MAGDRHGVPERILAPQSLMIGTFRAFFVSYGAPACYQIEKPPDAFSVADGLFVSIPKIKSPR
jgi:hypothetical protein